MDKKLIRVGVVGVGYLGEIHARIFSNMPNVSLAAVMDIDSAKGKKIATTYNCRYINCYDELIDIVDAVSIVVPTSQHKKVAEIFLRKRMPVLLEKPIAQFVSEAESIVNIAESNSTLLQVGHVERFNAGVIRLNSELRCPKFIEAHRLGPFVMRVADVDVISDLMIHDIDIILSLVKSDIKYISATGARVVSSHVDIANARIEFENGAVANLNASRISERKFRRIRVFGDGCYIALNFDNQKIEITKPEKVNGNDSQTKMATQSLDILSRPPLEVELEHFIDCVESSRIPLVGGKEGLVALKVADQVRRAIEKNL